MILNPKHVFALNNTLPLPSLPLPEMIIDQMFDLESHLPDELMVDNTWVDSLAGGNKPPGPGPGPQMNGGDDPGGTSNMAQQMALRQQQLNHIMQQQVSPLPISRCVFQDKC